jgi:hypothetical protein
MEKSFDRSFGSSIDWVLFDKQRTASMLVNHWALSFRKVAANFDDYAKHNEEESALLLKTLEDLLLYVLVGGNLSLWKM